MSAYFDFEFSKFTIKIIMLNYVKNIFIANKLKSYNYFSTVTEKVTLSQYNPLKTENQLSSQREFSHLFFYQHILFT